MKWQGKGVSEGLAMAQIHLFTPKLPEISRQPAADAEAEVAKLEATLAAAEEELRGLYETAKEKMGEQEAEIFDAHLTILGDEYSVREPIIQRIRDQKQNAAAAIEDQFDELAQMFRSLGDELMAERAEHKGGVAIGRVPALERVERIRLLAHGVLQHGGHRRGGIRPLFADERGVAAGNDIPFCIDHTDGGLCGFAELEQYALKHTT